jgi:hypothetical protein
MMPMRTCLPLTPTTVTLMSEPIQSAIMFIDIVRSH